ncbi:MAG: SMC-Scp complex subunit ScpB [Patescibacteria group bacterium]
MNLASQLEAVLFYKSEPIEIATLARLLKVDEGDIKNAIETLKNSLQASGLRLMEIGSSLTLVTAPEVSELIERLAKEELAKDIGKAGLETLTIILYRGEASRAEIDYVRGVNSSFILRHLLIRGLVLRLPNPNDARSFVYRPTADLLAHLGISNIEELPEFKKIENEIKNFMQKPVESTVKVTTNP